MAYSSISKPSLHFDTKLYTGGNGSATTISGLNFAPDFVWAKSRGDTGVHALMDRLRSGSYGHGWLRSESTDAENNTNGRGNISSFTSDGYVLSADTWGASNEGTTNHVAWNWKAGGAGSSNTDGSITSTVSANTTAGFSIVTYTGTAANATIGHGLGVAPKVIMTKSRVNAENWGVYHEYLGNTRQLTLNTTGAQTGQSAAYYNNTSPTSTVFSVGTADSTNDNQNMIAYCFAEKKGFSKFGNYTGNGDANGPFIYTGFKPAFFLIKEVTDVGTNWLMYDNKRTVAGNPNTKVIYPNLSNSEGTGLDWDFLNNGVKCRNNNGGVNGSTNEYIYMAFAEEPLVANVGASIPATAQ